MVKTLPESRKRREREREREKSLARLDELAKRKSEELRLKKAKADNISHIACITLRACKQDGHAKEPPPPHRKAKTFLTGAVKKKSSGDVRI